MKLGIIMVLAGFISNSNAADQLENIHSNETIGTVSQVYDGALMPDIQANTFRNIDRLFPTRIVRRGDNVYPLPKADKQITDISFISKDESYDLVDYITLNRISGLLVIKDGKIAHESYHLGNSDKTRWMSMSVVKSISATMVGIAIKDGFIKSIDDPLTQYLPVLKGSAYDGVTVKNLLQMASGVKWDETYTNPKSDRRHLLEAQIAQKPGGMIQVMSQLPRAGEPGTVWNYSTGETQVLSALLNAAIDRPLSQYVSDRLWAKFGMESDANWWLESSDGEEVGGSGLSATLRDYGRFGQFLLGNGMADGQAMLPEGWLKEASTPKMIDGKHVDYGYMLWPVAESEGALHQGAYQARGIFGQTIYVNPTENLVIAFWSARPKPLGKTTVSDYDFMGAIIKALR